MQRQFCYVFFLLFGWASVASAALDNGQFQLVQQATYEVVFKKPEKDPLAYEKPLPLERIPFSIRNDKYLSVGTAFAIGGNEYVTAAHVFMLNEETQFGEPFLRDAKGNVYAIDQILKYSEHRDFVVFSVKKAPASAILALNPKPQLNENVYAVGNALGEGIVVRDGLYTSDTPEERNGEWKWIRFSAAASPGNSGGPLLDKTGRVIGIILRKSENENLNYALPIAEVQKAKRVADLDVELAYIIDNTDMRETDIFAKKFSLPKSYKGLKAEVVPAMESFGMTLMQRMFSKNRANIFPEGDGSLALLNDSFSSSFPRLIIRGSDGVWDAYEPKDIRKGELGNNGRVWYGSLGNTWYLRVLKPDNIPLDRFYSDPKLFLDTLLKGFPATRDVGSEEVRVTSMGKPEKDYIYTDHYQRKWQVRIWPQAYNDTKIITFSLPVPGGYVARVYPVSTAYEIGVLKDLEALSDFMYFSYYGTMAQWKEFLSQRKLLPKGFEDISIDIAYGKKLSYRSGRLAFNYGPESMKITPNSDLELEFSYFKENGKVLWDVASVMAGEDKNSGTFFQVTRTARPPASLDDQRRSKWERIETRAVPFNGAVYYDKKKSFISSVYSTDVPKQPDVLYTMSYGVDGTLKQEDVAARLSRLSGQVKVLEYGSRVAERGN